MAKKKVVYPENWKEIRKKANERAEWVCEHCGMDFHKTRKAKYEVRTDGKPFILTVHHLDGDTNNNHWTNLLSCCQKCHLHIQRRWSPGWALPKEWNGVPKWLTERKLKYLQQRKLL